MVVFNHFFFSCVIQTLIIWDDYYGSSFSLFVVFIKYSMNKNYYSIFKIYGIKYMNYLKFFVVLVCISVCNYLKNK